MLPYFDMPIRLWTALAPHIGDRPGADPTRARGVSGARARMRARSSTFEERPAEQEYRTGRRSPVAEVAVAS
ncbi:hypothetical protein ACVWXB_000991 [Streptomyces sp. TE12347]